MTIHRATLARLLLFRSRIGPGTLQTLQHDEVCKLNATIAFIAQKCSKFKSNEWSTPTSCYNKLRLIVGWRPPEMRKKWYPHRERKMLTQISACNFFLHDSSVNPQCTISVQEVHNNTTFCSVITSQSTLGTLTRLKKEYSHARNKETNDVPEQIVGCALLVQRRK